MQTTEVREEELEPEEEEEEEESSFLVLGEYSWSSGSSTEVFSPSCFSWSSRYDLLALSSSTGTLSVHRLDWRTIPAPISATALVSAVAWSPSSSNSRVLAVGTAAGTVEAICSETGTLLWQTRLPNPINSLHWAELTLPSSDTTRTSSETKGTGGVSNITHVDDALLHVTDERHTNSLVVAVAGDLELMLDDGFRLATVSLGYSTCRLQKVLVDPCLRWIVLASGDPLFVIKVRMDAIRDNMDEIKVVSNCWKRIQTSLERIRTVASEIIRIWKPARTRFESKMSLLLDQMKNFGDDEYWTPENIMIDYLFSGIGGEAVHQFFGKELEVTNLARLEEAVVGALTKVASTLFPDLKKSIRELIKIISELLERSKIPKFQYVGLVESSLNSFLEAASMLLLNFEASFVMVIDCLQRYSLFFEWIVLCCKKHSEGLEDVERVKLMSIDVKKIRDFLLNDFSTDFLNQLFFVKLPSRIFSSDFFVEELSDLMKLSHGANVDTMSLISNCEDLWKSVRDLPHLLLSKNLSNHEVSVLRSFNMSPPIFDMKQFEIDGSEIWLASFGSACSTILNLEVVTIELDSFSQQSVQLDLGERISCMGIQFPMIQHLEFVNDTVFIIIQSSETDSTFATMWKIDLPSIRYHFIGNSPISSTITKAIYCERYSNLGSFQATFIALSESRNLCAIGKNNNRICILDLA